MNGQITGLLLRGAPSPNRGGEASLLFVVAVMVAGGVMSLPRTDASEHSGSSLERNSHAEDTVMDMKGRAHEGQGS